MMRTWVQVGLCVLLVCGALAAGPVAAQGDGDSDAPYIYYYSYAHNAFVIERADGTDTRLLGEGITDRVIDEEYTMMSSIEVGGPGWSPSGKWFAWIKVLNFQGYPARTKAVYILSVDGQRRLTLLDDRAFDYVQAVWAEDADLLLVAGQSIELSEDRQPGVSDGALHRYMALIDVPAGEILADVSESMNYLEGRSSISVLTPTVFQIPREGTFVAQFYEFDGGTDVGTISLYSLNVSGQTSAERIPHIYVSTAPGYESPSFTYSPRGWVTYVPYQPKLQHNDRRVVVKNLITGETVAINNCGDSVQWIRDGTQLQFIGHRICRFDTATRHLREVAERVDSTGFWTSSPDGETVIEFGIGNSWDLFVHDLRTDSPTLTKIPSPDPDWLGPSWFYTWRWGPGGRVILEYDEVVYLVDLDAQTFQRLETLPPIVGFDVYMSSSGRYTIGVPQGPIVYDALLDRLTYIRPTYRGWQTFSGGSVDLDDREQWLFIFENIGIAGGDGCCTVGISRIDGTQRRDLVYVNHPPQTMYTWLPPQVDPADLPPVRSEPLDLQPAKVLHGHAWAQFITWSPDGKLIAAASYEGEEDAPVDPALTIWDGKTGAIVEQRTLSQGSFWVDWDTDGAGGYTARVRSGGFEDTGCTVDHASPPVVVLPTFRFEPFPISDLHVQDLSPDGHWCATGSASGGAIDPEVVLWDATTWEPVVTLPNSALALAFSPDGTQLAVAASWDVQIWDVADLLAWRAEQP
jgi:hypothetical protein